MTVDWNGLSVFIGALAGLITVLGTTGMQVAIFIRQGKSIAASRELHASVEARLPGPSGAEQRTSE